MKTMVLTEIAFQDIKDFISLEIKKAVVESLALMESKEPDEYLTRHETAEFLKITLSTVHDWIKRGVLKPYKVGNRTYFSREEIVTVLKESNKS